MGVPDSACPDAYAIYDLIGGVDHRPIGWSDRVRRRIENLPPAVGVGMVMGAGLGLYGGALAGVSIGLAGNGSLVYLMIGIPITAVSAVIAAHLVPPRIMELREKRHFR